MIPDPRTGDRLRPDLPFRFIGGDPALDLVNTVDWTRRGPDDERMTDYARFTEFAEGAGVIDHATAERLRERAEHEPYAAAQAHRRVLVFRDALQRIVASGNPSDSRVRQALGVINAELRSALAHLELRDAGSGLALDWGAPGQSLDAPLWPIAWSAAQLLSSEERPRIRACAAPDCGWVYVDRSRNRLRRWCQMETCGNRAKAQRRYSRVRRTDSQAT